MKPDLSPSSRRPARESATGGLVIGAGLLVAVYSILTCCEFILWDGRVLPGEGTIGAEQAQFTPAPEAGRGFVQVAEVAEDSPLAQAGVRAGDRLRFEPVYDYLRYRRSGEHVTALVDRDEQPSRVEVVAVPREGPADWDAIRFYLGNLVPALVGALIMARSKGRRSALLLAAAFITFAPPSPSAMMLEGGRTSFLVFSTLNRACIVSVAVFLLAFAMSFYAETVGALGRRHWLALTAYAAANLIALCLWCYSDYTAVPFPVLGTGTVLVTALGNLGFFGSLVYLALGWKRSIKVERNRFSLFLVGVSALVVSQALAFIVLLGISDPFGGWNHPLMTVAEILSGIVAPAMLTHAILRHRVLDLGFILNRTIFFAIASTVVLIAFGLIERAVDHLVDIRDHDQSAFLDAGVTLGIYLVFHRFRHGVEGIVKSTFFHEWHEREAALRRAMARAAFITVSDPLIEAVSRAIEEFGASTVAVYLKRPNGAYELVGDERAGFARVLDQNQSMVVQMRAEGRPARMEAGDLGNFELGLPMARGHELIGILMVGPKADQTDYRSDEVELLGWAAKQFGLDLLALEIDRLEGTLRERELQILQLQARVAQLPVPPPV